MDGCVWGWTGEGGIGWLVGLMNGGVPGGWGAEVGGFDGGGMR